jgi:ribosome-binding protein aMBF1 (putative translation factor)
MPITDVISSAAPIRKRSRVAKHRAQTKTHGELVAEQELADPGFREEWERLAVARAVAATVIAYRADHALSQRALAQLLDVPQPQVARLESGEFEPSNKTLMRLASRLGLEFTISITAADREPKQLTKSARETVIATYEHNRSALRFTAVGA